MEVLSRPPASGVSLWLIRNPPPAGYSGRELGRRYYGRTRGHCLWVRPPIDRRRRIRRFDGPPNDGLDGRRYPRTGFRHRGDTRRHRRGEVGGHHLRQSAHHRGCARQRCPGGTRRHRDAEDHDRRPGADHDPRPGRIRRRHPSGDQGPPVGVRPLIPRAPTNWSRAADCFRLGLHSLDGRSPLRDAAVGNRNAAQWTMSRTGPDDLIGPVGPRPGPVEPSGQTRSGSRTS